MNDTVLDISFRKYSLYRLRKTCQVISAGDKNIINASVTQTIQNACPEFDTFLTLLHDGA